MRVTVLGSNLTARHFIKYLTACHETVQVSVWTHSSVNYPEIEAISECLRFTGFKNLPTAILGADVVVNLHECTDFSLSPDVKLLQLHNVELVRSILFHINSPLIHLSSPFLQCSNRWPNVYEPERDPSIYSAQWPFKEYCRSKYEAEMMINDSTNDCYIVRCVPTYGEGDDCSILTDLIYLSNDNTIISIGDNDGHMQMAYAGNISFALWSATCRLVSQSTTLDLNGSFGEDLSDLISSADNTLRTHDFEDVSKKPALPTILEEDSEVIEGYRARNNTVRTSCDVELEPIEEDEPAGFGCDVFDQDLTGESEPALLETKASYYDCVINDLSSVSMNEKRRILEVFLVNDETPKKTVYNTYPQLLCNGKRHRSRSQFAFIPIYYFYLLVSLLIRFATHFIGPTKFSKMLPDPSFLYFYFHHWTFFNSTKSQLMLDYKPNYDFKESMENSTKHYRELRKKDVHLFSWQNSISSVL